MTQEQALAQFKLFYPQDADYLQVEREHCIGYRHSVDDAFRLWNHRGGLCQIVATSNRSWEHALAIAKSGNEDIWPEDHEFEEESHAATL